MERLKNAIQNYLKHPDEKIRMESELRKQFKNQEQQEQQEQQEEENSKKQLLKLVISCQRKNQRWGYIMRCKQWLKQNL